MREKEVGKPLPSLRLEQTARFGCTVTVLFNTRRDTKETDIKMEKSTRHASNTVNERQTRYRFPIARAEVCHDDGQVASRATPLLYDGHAKCSTITHGIFFFPMYRFSPFVSNINFLSSISCMDYYSTIFTKKIPITYSEYFLE